MSEVCKIETEKIVNGAMMFHESDIVTWNSPLDKLENGTYMFALASSLQNFRCYDDGEATGKSYCEMASLSNAHGMFFGTKVSFHGEVLDVPQLKTATRMFEEANIGGGNGKIQLNAEALTDGSRMFYGASAEALYINLGNTAGAVIMEGAFAGVDITCGFEIEKCGRITNATGMFQDAGKGEQIDIWLKFDDWVGYNWIATGMFQNVVAKELRINSYGQGYSSYGYYSTNQKSFGDENFFTMLSSLVGLENASDMFYDFKNPNNNVYKKNITETNTCTNPWDKLTSTDRMFYNSPIGNVTLTNDLFMGSEYDALSSESMFEGAIKYYYSLGDSGQEHTVEIGGMSFTYCNNASSMFKDCDGITKVTLIGRKTLCNKAPKTGIQYYYAIANSMFEGCTRLKTFETRSDNNSQVETGYHKVSSGVNCFKGCVLEGYSSLASAYHLLSSCSNTTIGISKSWAQGADGTSTMTSIFGVCYPTLSTSNGIFNFEYN